jgi:asparagine synthase (glutamine-hydrolysing)
LLDHQLVSYVATLPPSFKLKDGVSKYLFRKMIARYLPSGILEKKKQGFAIPRETWFRSDLKAHARERLLDPKAIGRGYFDPRILDQVLTYHAAGQRDYSGWIWCLLVLEEWHRAYIDPATRRI